MPRGFGTKLTQSVVEEINKLHEQGVYRKEIAKQLKLSYTSVCQVLNPKEEKVPITSVILADIEKEITTLSLDDISKKYKRTNGEMRCLIIALGWELPDNYKELNPEEHKDKIQELLNEGLTFKQIGEMLGIKKNKVYYIAVKNNLSIPENVFGKRVKEENKGLENFNNLLKLSADSIKEKLRKQYEKRKENKNQQQQ